MSSIVLRPDGPHSHDYTLEVADAIYEAVRVLNYAADHGRAARGIPYPSTIYFVVGNLGGAVYNMDDLFSRFTARMRALGDADRLEVRAGPHAGRPDEACEAAVQAFAHVRSATIALFAALEQAHRVIAPIGARDDEDA